MIAVPGEASAFTIDKDPGGYLLQWSAPGSGAAVNDYVLYRTGFGAFAPTCETNLGTGTSAVVATLPDDHAFVVVARNGNGEGSYGSDSGATERLPATGGDVCP